MTDPTLRLIGLAVLGLAVGCTRSPTPLNPAYRGSIGLPHAGMLTDAAELARDRHDLRWLRPNDRHFGLPRFTATLERAASRVAVQRTGSVLWVGDLSARRGGRISGHASHRTGRDADLLLYMTTLDGVPVASPGFVPIEPDGLGFDAKTGRYLRFDVEREWLLVKALVEDNDARIQWIFVSEVLEALLIQWARARGETPETVWRAHEVMLQPRVSAPHDDHLHVRTSCTTEETVSGCEPSGPSRPWHSGLETEEVPTSVLIDELVRPIDPH